LRIENTTIGVLSGDPEDEDASGSMTNVVIQGNAFLNNRNSTDPDFPNLMGRGISAREATDVSILSNVFAGNQEVAVLLGKPDAPPQQNQALADEEVFVSDTTISSNLFDASLSAQSSGAGIVLLNATSVTLTKNTVRGGTTVGIQLDAQDGSQTTQPSVIAQNNISGVAGDGMFFGNSLLSASVTRNTVSGNTGNGIVVSEVAAFVNAFNVFSRNKVFGNGGGFLLFNAIGNNLDNNAITGNGNGIIVNRSQDNFFRNNVIRSSSVDGIFVNEFGSGNVFTRNRIQDSGRFDINDASIGDETYGTLNVYRSNKATVTNPPELGTATK
jgi:parallel beta-helix repeat protein